MESLTADDPSVMGEFRLRARLGSGGMGRVYLGFSPAGRAVAIKVVHPQLARDPEFLERFGREVAAARSVSGMYTAPVVAAGLNDDPPWLATAFVPGPSLAEIVQQHGALPEAAVWRLGAGLAEALRAVHTAGLVHRDLKPANVLVAADGPHVIDFGISRALEGTSLTSAGMVVGTPGYMSPEQADGRMAGPASDVFSFGCVLAYAATGNAPFGSGSAASILYKVVTGEPDLSRVSPALRDVIAACVAKNPAERPTLSALIATIAASGPEVPVSLSAFWPEPMASIVASGQPDPGAIATGPGGGGPAAAGLAAAAQAAESGGPGGVGGGPGGPGQLGYVPTAMVPPGQPAPSPVPSPAPGFAGHAGMLPDGYYAAATGNPPTPQPGSAAGPATGYGTTGYGANEYGANGYGANGYGANGYGATQTAGAAWGQPPSPQWPGAGSAAGTPAPPWSQQPASPPGWGQQGAAWPQPATPTPQPPTGQPATPWPGQGGTPAQWVQYTPGRRRPMKSEVPSHVLLSIRLMWAGLAAGVLELIFGAIALGRFDHRAGSHPTTHDQLAAQSMAGIAAISVVVSFLGLFCWVWLALACRRGRGWTRIAAAVLAGLNTVGLLFIILGTHDILGPHYDSGLKLAGCLAWIIGLTSALLLWGNQARTYFLAWRS